MSDDLDAFLYAHKALADRQPKPVVVTLTQGVDYWLHVRRAHRRSDLEEHCDRCMELWEAPCPSATSEALHHAWNAFYADHQMYRP